ncbi:MAG: hypothetical protein JSS00_11685 [Proteobacteria bacterium]|nr:hypothetical protein [Pseudomonadota bacterium]
MSAAPALRAAVLAGGMLAAGAFTLQARAQEAPSAPSAPTATQDNPTPRIDFRDPTTALSRGMGPLDVSARANDARFAPVGASEAHGAAGPQPVELQIAADRSQTGAPVDVSFAHRGLVGADTDRQGHGSEVRIGRGLVTRDNGTHHRGDSVYAFVASDNQALTWRPGARSEFGGAANSLVLQDTVNVGDNSAGVTYEHDGVQASLAYVQRTIRTRVGNRGYSQDEDFAGVTVTMRH